MLFVVDNGCAVRTTRYAIGLDHYLSSGLRAELHMLIAATVRARRAARAAAAAAADAERTADNGAGVYRR